MAAAPINGVEPWLRGPAMEPFITPLPPGWYGDGRYPKTGDDHAQSPETEDEPICRAYSAVATRSTQR
jgi:hypothetical protein